MLSAGIRRNHPACIARRLATAIEEYAGADDRAVGVADTGSAQCDGLHRFDAPRRVVQRAVAGIDGELVTLGGDRALTVVDPCRAQFETASAANSPCRFSIP